MISEQDKERIEREAEARYLLDDPKMNMLHDNMSQYAKRDAYISGATAENLRYQPCVEALKNLIEDVKSKPNDTRYATRLKAATDALNQLNA